ncbi:MAG: hypothetical protein JXP34_05360 [Planctomycetes bacterium]|nr:hypothetical protein [Planctomycetota bacterium]
MSPARALLLLRWWRFARGVRELWGRARLKLCVVAIFTAGIWAALFAGTLAGLRFLESLDLVESPTESGFFVRAIVTDYGIASLLFTMLVMLTVSTAIILTISLFRSPEAEFLRARPVPSRTIFAYFLADALFFATWAFLFLGLPIFIAYGVSYGAPLWYYPLVAAALVPFIVLCAALGALLSLALAGIVARWRGRRSRLALIAACLLVAVATISVAYAIRQLPARLQPIEVLRRLEFTRSVFLPSRWIAAAVRLPLDASVAPGERAGRCAFYIFLTASYAFFALSVAAAVAGRSYGGLASALRGSARRRRGRARVRLPRFGRPGSLVIWKDILSFRRDVAQWSQVLLFFGLLGVYFYNIRGFRIERIGPEWKPLVSFLNLAATMLTLATFTSRFVFPAVSLEAARFWILGLAPLARESLLAAKFAFGFIGSLALTETLIIISDTAIGVDASLISIHAITVVVICAALNAASIGLGALFPSPREMNPSKIVSGFGGTLNWVVSFLYIGFAIIVELVPYLPFVRAHLGGPRAFAVAQWASLGVVFVAGAALVAVPLTLGLRAFRRMEF